ncbi:MAG: type IV secretion system protein TraC [Magnetococcales bacterium]|nr:type IV secretion system protein TraC [Magnetococcales bacterium]NGZ25388.1 type IV secretion system protein TraC [Magnetococcales bacterium]
MSGKYNYKRMLDRNALAELMSPLAYGEGLFLLSDGYLGFGFTSFPLAGVDERGIERIAMLFTAIEYPPGSFLQVMLYASPDIEPYLKEMERLRAGCPFKTVTQAVSRRVDYLRSGTTAPLMYGFGTLIRDYQVVFTVKMPLQSEKGEPTDDEINLAKTFISNFKQLLISADFFPTPLTPDGWLYIVGCLMHWKESATWRREGNREGTLWDKSRLIRDHVSQFDQFLEVDSKGIWLGEKRLKFLSPQRLPATIQAGGMRNLIGDLLGARGLGGNFFINMNCFFPDGVTEKQSLSTKRDMLIHQSMGALARFNPGVTFRMESANLLMSAFQEGQIPVKVSVQVGLFSNDHDAAEAYSRQAMTYLGETGWSFQEDKYIALPLLVNVLPFGADREAVTLLWRYHTLASKHAAAILPVVGDWRGTGTSAITLISRSGQPMAVDLFDSSTNYNSYVVAASGSGKSFFVNEIITAYLSMGALVWAIDIGRSYEKLCRVLEGEFIAFGDDGHVCLNPFFVVNNIEEEGDMLAGIFTAMISFRDPLSDFQSSVLRQAIQELWYVHKQKLTVDILAEYFKEDDDQRIRDMGQQLFAFTSHGEYGRYFVGDSPIAFDKAFTVLELEELRGKAHLQQVVLLILIHRIQQEMYLGDRGRKKIIVIDEAWGLLGNEGTGPFIESAFRRARKYGGAIMVITQNATDLVGRVGRSVVDNSAFRFLLQQNQESIARAESENMLGIPSEWVNTLRTVRTIPGKFSEILVRSGEGIGVGRLVVDPFSKLLYSTKAEEVSAIQVYVKNGYSVAEAITSILEQQANKAD